MGTLWYSYRKPYIFFQKEAHKGTDADMGNIR